MFFWWLFIYHCIILRWISSTFFNHHWYYCMFHLQVAKWWRLDSRYPPGHLWKNLKSKALSVLIDSEVERSCFFLEKWVRVDSRSWTSKTHVLVKNMDMTIQWYAKMEALCVSVCVCLFLGACFQSCFMVFQISRGFIRSPSKTCQNSLINVQLDTYTYRPFCNLT